MRPRRSGRGSVITVLFLGSLFFAVPFAEAASDIRPASGILQPLESRGAGARAYGMGSAFVAVDGTVESLFFNPAGLSSLSGFEVMALHYEGFEGLREERIGGAFSVGRLGVFGAEAHSMGYGRVDSRDEEGNLVGSHRPGRWGAGLGWGGRILPSFSAGGSVRVARQWFGRGVIDTLSFDAGVQAAAGPRVHLGAACRGIGKYGDNYLPPMLAEVGGTFRPGGEWPLLLAVSAAFQFHGVHYINLGVEQALSPGFKMRIGSRIPLTGERIEGFRSFTAGFGYRKGAMILDYAVEPEGDLGFMHRISLSAQVPAADPQPTATRTSTPTPSPTETLSPTSTPTMTPSSGSWPPSGTLSSSFTATPSADQLRVYYEGPAGGATALSASGRVKELLEAVRRPGAGLEPWWELGQLYELSGYPGYAKSCYEKVLLLDPKHEGARKRLLILGQ